MQEDDEFYRTMFYIATMVAFNIDFNILALSNIVHNFFRVYIAKTAFTTTQHEYLINVISILLNFTDAYL